MDDYTPIATPELIKAYFKLNQLLLRRIRTAVTIRSGQEPTAFVDREIFATLPVRVTHLPFGDDEQIDFEARFTRPLGEDFIDELLEGRTNFRGTRPNRPQLQTGHERHALDWAYFLNCTLHLDAEIGSPPLMQYTMWRDLKGMAKGYKGNLNHEWADNDDSFYQLSRNDSVNWSTVGIYGLSTRTNLQAKESCRAEHPHVSCIMYHNAPIDDRVTRSEFICITYLMRRRINAYAWREHAFFPVFLYRCTDTHLRITQAHCDGAQLHVRHTDPIPLTGVEANANLRLILRWILAEPLSRTSVPETDRAQCADAEGTIGLDAVSRLPEVCV